MKITIQGQDYTGAFDHTHPLTVERKLNEPTVCELWLSVPAGGALAAPSRFQSLAVTGDDGTIYFTGYVAVTPVPEYAGTGVSGPLYRLAVQAVSDEILLDQMLMPPSAGISEPDAGTLLACLVAHTGSKSLAAETTSVRTEVGNFSPERGASWSKSAGQAATMARAAYRALDGVVSLLPMQTIVHPLNESDGSLNLSNLVLTGGAKRALANDVTVCGENEPAAYVTEYFLGDGVATQFNLAEDPYFPPTSQSTVISELFNGPQINETVWGVTGGAGFLTLGPKGLAINGGNGIDGQTLLQWLDPIEMGGTLLLETAGVMLSPGSSGIIAGFFTSLETAATCTAGFQATADQTTGALTLQPIVQGSPAGTTFALNPANQYTLRVRIHCPECNRAQAFYYSYGDKGPVTEGGDWAMAPANLQMEIQEFANGVGATPVTLYDGALANLPGVCLIVPASSVNLNGSIRSVTLTNSGPVWVVSTPPNGGPYTRRIGTTAESAECYVDRAGKLTFYAGYLPVAGEQIAVNYRTIARAAGRAVNTASQQSLAQAGLPAVAAWIGSVTHPPARSSADCRNAASAMEQAAAGVSALWSGTYKGNRTSFASDVWPGDALLLNAPSTNLNAEVVVRTVKVIYGASCPDLVEYEIAFANDWADDLAIKTSSTVPANTWLPAAIAPTFAANLLNLTVPALNGSTVTVNTGVTPPAGGGFEIRLRDFAFMPGEDPTLVTRGSQPTLTFSRASAGDRFYIRMYDGSTPPNYSEFSAALFINLPVGS
jgi:hypothetical protein